MFRSSSSFSSSRSSTSRYCDTEDEKRDLDGSGGEDCSGSSNEVSISSFKLGRSRKRGVPVPGVDRGCCWVEQGRENLDDRDADAGDGWDCGLANLMLDADEDWGWKRRDIAYFLCHG